MVIAGHVTRPDLMTIRPDLGFFRNIPTVIRLMRAGGDDAVLTRAVRFFEGHGLEVLGVHDVAPELLAPQGVLGCKGPADDDRRDIATGRAVIQALGRLDVGQSVVVSGGRVLAIEGAEGTDRMLQRVAALRDQGHSGDAQGVLVKVPKPGQELRVDMPSIGPNTVARAREARLAGLAVAAGSTLVLETAQTVRAADEHGLFVTGEQFAAIEAKMRASASASPQISTPLGKLAARQGDLADAARAAAVCQRLQPFGAGAAAVVIRAHVLAVAAEEGPAAMATRVATLRQWGTKRLKSRRGAVAVRLDDPRTAAATLTAMAAALGPAAIAGIAVIDCPHENLAELVMAADHAGVFLVTVAAPETLREDDR